MELMKRNSSHIMASGGSLFEKRQRYVTLFKGLPPGSVSLKETQMSEERPRDFGGFRAEVESEQILSRNGSCGGAAKNVVSTALGLRAPFEGS